MEITEVWSRLATTGLILFGVAIVAAMIDALFVDSAIMRAIKSTTFALGCVALIVAALGAVWTVESVW